MGLLDQVLDSVSAASGQGGGIGAKLLGLLASESGSGTGDAQSPVAVSGGLQELVQRFEQSGLGDIAKSWISGDSNQPIAPDQLHQAVGPQTIDRLSQQTGLDKNALLPLLAKALPAIIDRLTPNGKIPSEAELSSGGGQTASA